MRSMLSKALFVLIAASAAAQDDSGDDRADERVRQSSQRIAEKGYERSGSAIREMLVATGLSPEDSERIAKSFVDGLVSCLVDAARSEALEQSLRFDEILSAFEQAMDDSAIEEPTIIDMRRVDQKAENCAFLEMQKAGISFDLITQ